MVSGRAVTAALRSAQDFITFVNASPSPFHAVAEVRTRLEAAGFTRLSERDAFKIAPNGKYYFTRNQSSIVAFAVGGKYQRGNGFSIVGAHTDSPCLKVKPISAKEEVGYAKVGVELYGGGLWHTWFDRDLGAAGRVIVKSASGAMEHRLINIRQPILRIPTLAIHLDRSVSEGFTFNNETHLQPIISSAEKSLNEGDATGKPKHTPLFLRKVSDALGVAASEITDFEVCLYDTHPSTIGGGADEYIFSARLDNLMSSYCALSAITAASNLENETQVRMIALFDNEEVGSNTAHGADSNLLEVSIKRVAQAEIADGLTAVSPSTPTGKDWEFVESDAANAFSFRDQRVLSSAFEQTLAKSFLISADMAHAVHPNYSEKHESGHRPQMNKGVVIKQNANQRYATTAVTMALLREIAKTKDVALQEFVVRNDSPCGSTIGPMLSASLGMRTVDVGNPQLSMHSIRETCGVADVKYAIDLFTAFFEQFASVDARLRVD